MTFQIEDVVERLADAGVRLDRGLTEADVKRLEKKYGFIFGPDHRALLRTALPLGDAWLNWRHATAPKIKERLQWPIEGVILDVRATTFWPASWGARPDDVDAAERIARERLAQAPVLVPLYGHRYLLAAPASEGSPVFSVQQSDVSIYAENLLDYVIKEFSASTADATAGDAVGQVVGGTGPRSQVPPQSSQPQPQPLSFWSDLANGAKDVDL